MNNYSMQQGESLLAGGAKLKKPQSSRQIAGKDYKHTDVCLACGDGGDLICCDHCACSYHPSCVGLDPNQIPSFGWSCPQHSCHECGRNAAAAGGLLFRCVACPQSFCEDHLPVTAKLLREWEPYQQLGQNHPNQACFCYCTSGCEEFMQLKDQLEAAGRSIMDVPKAKLPVRGTEIFSAPCSPTPSNPVATAPKIKKRKSSSSPKKTDLVLPKKRKPSPSGKNTDVEKFPIGTRLLKEFDGTVYQGEVVSYDATRRWYMVKYEDGDQEEMTATELSMQTQLRSTEELIDIDEKFETFEAKENDTPTRISKLAGVDLAQLVEVNKEVFPELTPKSKLRKGTTLLLPHD